MLNIPRANKLVEMGTREHISYVLNGRGVPSANGLIEL